MERSRLAEIFSRPNGMEGKYSSFWNHGIGVCNILAWVEEIGIAEFQILLAEVSKIGKGFRRSGNIKLHCSHISASGFIEGI